MKIVLITGASSGFGLACAKRLSKKGYKLILVARREEKLIEIKKALKSETYIAGLDVTKRQDVRDFFKNLPEDFRKIDVLINNAGLALGMSGAQDADIDDWEQMVDTNIKGLLYVTRQALEIMKKKSSGQIINVGSIAATVPYKGGNVYGATKAFVRQFSRNLRTDLLGSGIKVSNIEPGAAETEFSIVRFKNAQQAEDYYKGWRPLVGDDIASAIEWVIEQPEHVNVENIEIMPTDQSYAGITFSKES